MTEESALPDLGGTKPQWYELLPDRLQEEIQLIQDAYPGFTLHQESGKNIYWIGEAKALKPDGSVLASLPIKVECDWNYPEIFPAVTDTSGTLKDRKCPHLSNVNGAYILCYGNRLDSQLDFQGTARVKDVIDYVCIFIARQWFFEQYGEWPGGQPHGELAFLEYEIKIGSLDPTDICPCGLHAKKYRECHMLPLLQMLDKLDARLKREIRADIKLKKGRNKPCLCGGGKKWKKCCLSTINYSSSKSFLLFKFPEAFGIDTAERDRMLSAIVEPIQNVTPGTPEKV